MALVCGKCGATDGVCHSQYGPTCTRCWKMLVAQPKPEKGKKKRPVAPNPIDRVYRGEMEDLGQLRLPGTEGEA